MTCVATFNSGMQLKSKLEVSKSGNGKVMEKQWKGNGKVMERRGDDLCCNLQFWNATEV